MNKKELEERYGGMIACGLVLMFALALAMMFGGCAATHTKIVRETYIDTVFFRDSVLTRDTIVQVRTEKTIVEKVVDRERTQDYRRGNYDIDRQCIVDTMFITYRETSSTLSYNELLDSIRELSSALRLSQQYQSHQADKEEHTTDIIEKKSIWETIGKYATFLFLMFVACLSIWKMFYKK